ncbi:MAG: fructose-bisphosphate aldolase class I [Gammaproteobacteria bacterium]|nr:fructose-bisphosphate aldolase class I [Gammaproteobacteria bacterium]
MNKQELKTTALSLVQKGKGLLAADESTATVAKRFATISLECTEETRRAYRSLLLDPSGLEKFISGVILYEETLRQENEQGVLFPELLKKKGIIPGIKVDKGAKDLAGFPGDTITEGLDGLRERIAEYKILGARFAKWRAVIAISGHHNPSCTTIQANAHALARYAALCQEGGLVPIVEPEVLMDGDHTIERCEEVTGWVWHALFRELAVQRVYYEGLLLKASMVASGKACPKQASVQDVAEKTVTLLKACVPALIPGVVFLSGGQPSVRATEHLNAMNRLGSAPWVLSFSYARALQEPALLAWRGQKENLKIAREALLDRAKKNSAACLGEYNGEL